MDADAIDEYLREINILDDLFIQYDTFITSTRTEIDGLEKELNARWLSRTGFAFDQMKINETQSRTEISERAAVVGEDAECIADATERLNTAVEIAGNGSNDVHSNVLREVNMYRYLYVYPQLSQLKRLVSSYEIQPLQVFRYENPVTEFDLILRSLISEISYLESQFEPFVDEFIEELGKFIQYTNSQSGVLFSTMQIIQNTFYIRIREIEGILANC